MLFVDRLLEREEELAVAEAVVQPSCIALHNGVCLPEYCIELIAQTSALANGFDQFVEDKPPRNGMLVGIDSCSVFRAAGEGSVLRIEIQKIFAFGAVSRIQGTVSEGDEIVAVATIKVWEDDTR
ncbi:MAG: ACP dehydratase [Desulfobacterales bacterium]|nr:MAG: ACP dehydratase [Desulfobacterales bacterium]